MLQTFGMEESQHELKWFRLHIQTWTYIFSGFSIFIALCGIVIGILGLLNPEWHETLIIYRQFLAYLRRSDPVLYWFCYKIFWIIWIFVHVTHFLTIIHTIVGVQMIKPRLVIPQLLHLIMQMGLFISILSSIIVISSTSPRLNWMSFLFFVIFLIPACANLYILVLFYQFLREKEDALQAVFANTKQVHFKEHKK